MDSVNLTTAKLQIRAGEYLNGYLRPLPNIFRVNLLCNFDILLTQKALEISVPYSGLSKFSLPFLTCAISNYKGKQLVVSDILSLISAILWGDHSSIDTTDKSTGREGGNQLRTENTYINDSFEPRMFTVH